MLVVKKSGLIFSGKNISKVPAFSVVENPVKLLIFSGKKFSKVGRYQG